MPDGITAPVIGRYAPSPTGPLHFGSMVAAVASYLNAKAAGGRWLVRIDDLDPPREQDGAADLILRTLEAAGLAWDGDVTWQSRRGEAYAAALEALAAAGMTFGCACSRRETGSAIYPGTCRQGVPDGRAARSVRVRVDDVVVRFVDRVQGPVSDRIAASCGDFVVRRADGLVAYHLAVVVDDAAAGVTEVVRGADLLALTPRQIYLQSLLQLPQPAYAHIPVVVDDAGTKLSKQTGAAAVTPALAPAAVYAALDFLRLGPPPALRRAAPAELLDWGLAHWRLDACGRVARAYAAPLAAANIARSSA